METVSSGPIPDLGSVFQLSRREVDENRPAKVPLENSPPSSDFFPFRPLSSGGGGSPLVILMITGPFPRVYGTFVQGEKEMGRGKNA